MFIPRYLLPQFSLEELGRLQDRWNTPRGEACQEQIVRMIKSGAGKNFLEPARQQGSLPILEGDSDLRGFEILDLDADFPKGDNFRTIDFRYACFYHSTFRNATFLQTRFSFTSLHKCTFADCQFGSSGFYAAELEEVRFMNCVFMDRSTMTHCEFKRVTCQDCFFAERQFHDCRFDEQTFVTSPLERPRDTAWQVRLDQTRFAELHKGAKEAYRAGGVSKLAREYFFRERQCITRHNTQGLLGKMRGHFLECVAGYGVRPVRVLRAMLCVFLLFTVVFGVRFGFPKGLLLSAGAFFTFGGNIQELESVCILWTIGYIAESFLGICLIAMFITVLANMWFAER